MSRWTIFLTWDILKLMERIIAKLKNAHFAVAFTGAGVSTLSGIKDFRGKNGIYKEQDAEKIFDIGVFKKNPAFYYDNTREIIYNLAEKAPNIVHTELARWEMMGILKGVVTQNIDLLHQKGGSRNVVEIHGTPETHSCLNCHRSYKYKNVVDQLKEKRIPLCRCGGVLKPDVTFFGENLQQNAIEKARNLCSKADLILILGSSLVVQPAASLPLYTKRNGGKMIIVNNQPTPLDHIAHSLFSDLGEFFSYTKTHL